MLINFLGLLLDWLLTRDWRRVACLLLPAILVSTVLCLSFWGSALDKEELAAKYLEIGMREIDDATQSWAFRLEQELESTPPIPRFTEAVFRRARQLRSNNPNTTFVIGAILAQRGATAQAMALMASIAPESQEGYLPAHAWLARLMLRQQPVPEEQLPLLKHHLQLGVKWEDAPADLLAAATQLALSNRDNSRAIQLLAQSAEKQPEFEGELFRLAINLGNQRVAAQTAEKALPRLLERIDQGIATADDRITASQILFYQKEFDASRGVLEEGLRAENLAPEGQQKLRRQLSEFYRLRFMQTLKTSPTNWSADVRLLDQAMRADPTNPHVAEQVAMLARIGGDQPPDTLMDQLRSFLAQGTATPLTHSWLAEAYILRTEYDKAIEHLTTVLDRMPDSAQSLNNLAYALALSEPGRLEDALSYSQAAIKANPRVADYHDTLGFILMKMDRVTEAITEMELAVELEPGRVDFHQRLAEIYEQRGNVEMATAHRKIIEDLKNSASSSAPPEPASQL